MSDLKRTIDKARPADAGRGFARLDPSDFPVLGVRIGDCVKISAEAVAYARVMPLSKEERGSGRVLIDGLTRETIGVGVGDEVSVEAAPLSSAEAVRFEISGARPAKTRALINQIRRALENVPLASGTRVQFRRLGGDTLSAVVKSASPEGAVTLTDETNIDVGGNEAGEPSRAVSYEDLGGLRREIARVREMIELPIRRPDLFERLGISSPKGVLLSGPPGTGKTLLARAVAHEASAAFFQINGPEIIGKHYGESEQQLRAIFAQAESKAPSVVFIDELDAIAPKREGLAADRQVERRIVAQLLTLLDGVSSRGQVIVMAATNLPDSIDPALRRPGRFDREIQIGAPDREGRREILDIHTRGMPLAADVDLDDWAARTHGYVGSDLQALCREAGMAALRQIGDLDRLDSLSIDPDHLMVSRAAFDRAFAEMGPSTLREVTVDVPDCSFQDVGGLGPVRDALIEAVIWPLKFDALFDRYGLEPAKGVLLAGPPGTGKTLIARALACEAGVNFISIRGAQLLNQYVGESERAVRDVFRKARNAAPAVIFFDEIDALAPRRGDGGGAVLDRVVAQLLTEIDGLETPKGLFILGATNRPDQIDPALMRPGRFDLVFEVPLPDFAARRSIFAVHTRSIPLAEDVSLDDLAATTDGLSGADIKGICDRAARVALRRYILNGQPEVVSDTLPVDPVTITDFQAVLPADANISTDIQPAPKEQPAA